MFIIAPQGRGAIFTSFLVGATVSSFANSPSPLPRGRGVIFLFFSPFFTFSFLFPFLFLFFFLFSFSSFPPLFFPFPFFGARPQRPPLNTRLRGTLNWLRLTKICLKVWFKNTCTNGWIQACRKANKILRIRLSKGQLLIRLIYFQISRVYGPCVWEWNVYHQFRALFCIVLDRFCVVL